MKNLFKIIDERQQTHIFTKHLNDDTLEKLVQYIVDKKPPSVIDNLVVLEGSITKNGISKVVQLFNEVPYVLKRLDISDNGLHDNDIEPLLELSGLKELIVRDNFVTKKFLKQFENKGIKIESDFSDDSVIINKIEQIQQTSSTLMYDDHKRKSLQYSQDSTDESLDEVEKGHINDLAGNILDLSKKPNSLKYFLEIFQMKSGLKISIENPIENVSAIPKHK